MSTFDRYITYCMYVLVGILATYGALHLLVWFWVPILKRCFS
jgi:hypothetical protein